MALRTLVDKDVLENLGRADGGDGDAKFLLEFADHGVLCRLAEGDGVRLIGLDGSHVNFDFGADGFRERTGWASAGDGFLARDLDGNGRIESLSELFGDATQDAFRVSADTLCRAA